MGIPLAGNFDLAGTVPLDSRTKVPDFASLDDILNKYPGLIAYVTQLNKNYFFDNSSRWIEIAQTEPLITNFKAISSTPSPNQSCCPIIFNAGQTLTTLSVSWERIQENITFQNLTDALIAPNSTNFVFNNLNLNINNTPDFKRYTLTYGNDTITKSLFFDVLFRNRRFWGSSNNPNLNMSSIAFSFSGTGSDLENNRNQSNLLEPLNEYIYIAYPARFGDGIINANGFNVTWVKTVNSYLNPNGFQEDYLIYRSNNLLSAPTLVSVL
jgi:hypothetical protein